MEKYIYELKMKVRDYECDLQGIVNNANYQHYLEHTRHEFLLSIGLSFAEMSAAGYDVTREYYINDAGNQINNLAYSLMARYNQAFGVDVEMPEDGYHGEDIYDITKQIIEEVGDKYLDDSEEGFEFFKRRGTELELRKLEKDLEKALIDHLQKFLLELGRGFCFVERQKRISFDDEHYFIELFNN